MRPPETLGDWVFFLVVSTAVLALGVLLLAYPTEPIPVERSGYVKHSGLLEVIVARQTGRSSLVRFRIVNDPAVYESSLPRIHEVAAAWRDRQTELTFFSVLNTGESADAGQPRPVYGITANGVTIRPLEVDIEYVNAGKSWLGGLMAVAIGLLGYVAAGLWWWRRRAA